MRAAFLCLALGAGLLALAGSRSASGTPAAAGESTVQVARAVHALAALSIVTPGDVATATVPAVSAEGSDALGAAGASGRRLLVAVPAGALITAPMLAPVGRAPAGSRDLRLALDPLRVSPSVVAGGDAEVVTVSSAALGGGPLHAEVVAVVHVVDIGARPPLGTESASTGGALGSVLGGTPNGSLVRSDAGQIMVTVVCDPAAALRLALAIDAGMTIRLLGHLAGEPVPAPFPSQ